jgi:pSer/pThr/pTyr-binding forkhead associated (FHA) protein
MPSLVTISEEHPSKHFHLGQRTLAIGRDPSRDIQITDPKISRKHALLRFESGDYLISPAKALNGVLVNGEQVDSERALRDGDMITLGDTDLFFNESQGSDFTNALHVRKDVARANRDNNTIM